MNAPFVSLHPYFKVHAGHLEAAQVLLPRFVEQTRSEPGVLFYDFTVSGETVFCREGYVDGAATLAHLQNVDALLKEMLTHADLERLEIHGPAEELQMLRGPLRDLPVTWYERACGLAG